MTTFLERFVHIVYRDCLSPSFSVFEYFSFLFRFESGLWDFIVRASIPNHCLSFVFK